MKMFGGKTGTGGSRHSSEGGKTAASNKWMIWAAWLLSTAGFAILLGGVASMQASCDSSGGLGLLRGGLATVHYLGPVSCSHILQYAWWITFLHFFAWLLVLAYLAMKVIHKSRTALVGILAIAAVLLMDTANTFLMVKYIPDISGTMGKRVRTAIAGAIIAAVADVLLILIIGWDSHARHGDIHTTTYETHGHAAYTGATATTLPGTQTTQTTAGTVPVQVPV